MEPTASADTSAAPPSECARDKNLARYNVPLTVAGTSWAIGVWVESLPAETARAWVAESGPFEVASAVFYGMAALLAGFHLLQQMTVTRLAAWTMLVWACLRELDFQKRFTYRSIESIGYYSRPQAPWSEKLLVLLLVGKMRPRFAGRAAACHDHRS